MKPLQHSPAFLRKRKMLLVLPLIMLPFITLAFWALGGGKGTAMAVKQQSNDKGLNLELPGAQLKNEKGLDKLSYYELAQADSEKLKARMRDDPYFKLKTTLSDSAGEQMNDVTEGAAGNLDDDNDAPGENGLKKSPHKSVTNSSHVEEKVYDRLKQINAALNDAQNGSPTHVRSGVSGPDKQKHDVYSAYGPGNETVPAKENVDRLESMMRAMKQENGGGDSEMMAINNMLEKVMDIQHPERVNDRLKQTSLAQKQRVFAVIKIENANPGFYPGNTRGSFDQYGSSEREGDDDSTFQAPNAIEAVVSETQTLVNGATIKLRLLNDVYINGLFIPKDAFVFGKASLTGERLTVAVSGIRFQNAILPVALSVYDLDGMDGIYIPGAITHDVARQSTDNALQSIALNSLDPSIGAQAASAGIETVKTLISKKVKLVRVTVKAGYRVLLRDNHSK